MQGMTQEEIAKKLKYSRTKIIRLLQKARDVGIIEISINNKYRVCFDIEKELIDRFGLIEAVVVPTADTLDNTKEGVGIACASFLKASIKEHDIIGCAWGRILYSMGKALKFHDFKNITVVQLMGGLNTGDSINPQEILRLIASKLNAEGVWLNTPALVESQKVRDALLQDDSVRKTLDVAKKCTKIILGIGDTTEQASLVKTSALIKSEIKELRKIGAVGDVLSWFYDLNGVVVDHPITKRVLSVPVKDIKAIPIRIGGTSGEVKVKPILGAIKGKLINVLVTDENTAMGVIKLHDSTMEK